MDKIDIMNTIIGFIIGYIFCSIFFMTTLYSLENNGLWIIAETNPLFESAGIINLFGLLVTILLIGLIYILTKFKIVRRE